MYDRKTNIITCDVCGHQRTPETHYAKDPYFLSRPIPGNEFWPNTFYLIWVYACCRKVMSHTETAASFGEKKSDRTVNEGNASKASNEFNALPDAKRNIDAARRIVRKHGGEFIFDLWLNRHKRMPTPRFRQPVPRRTTAW